MSRIPATSIGSRAARPSTTRVQATSRVCGFLPGREHRESAGLSRSHPKGSACPDHPAQFWCNLSPFRINTCKSISKQTTLTLFRINIYEKTGEWGAAGHGTRITVHSPVLSFFSYSCALFCAFLHFGEIQLLSSQTVPHSLPKNTGCGGMSAALFDLPPRAAEHGSRPTLSPEGSFPA
jgi:hypothetical protein